MSVSGQKPKSLHLSGVSVAPSIVLKKSFWGDERNFLGPLMPFARGDVRDHIVSHKTTRQLRMGATQYCNDGAG
jgi:hypothetical protein